MARPVRNSWGRHQPLALLLGRSCLRLELLLLLLLLWGLRNRRLRLLMSFRLSPALRRRALPARGRRLGGLLQRLSLHRGTCARLPLPIVRRLLGVRLLLGSVLPLWRLGRQCLLLLGRCLLRLCTIPVGGRRNADGLIRSWRRAGDSSACIDAWARHSGILGVGALEHGWPCGRNT